MATVDAPGPTAPQPSESDTHLLEAQRIFRRTLAGWASDLLLLRHRGIVNLTLESAPAGQLEWAA